MMEAQQQNQLQQNTQHEEMIMNGGSGKLSTSSYLCRQSSSRWTPTTEQIRLLKELYYINGVRSPSADQIQSICARLRRYGKIEGKNVFYWFQNHKARERQKKRLTPTNTTSTTPPQYYNNNNNNNNNNVTKTGGLNSKQDQEMTLNGRYPCINNNPGVSCSNSSVGVVSAGGQLVESIGYGNMTMEYKFRDCSISGGVLNGAGSVNHYNSHWTSAGGTNYNPYASPTCYSNLLDKMSPNDEDHDQDHYRAAPEIETLPLFPMHNDDHHPSNGFCAVKHPSDGYYTGGYRWSNGSSGNAASLELSLNSYGYECYSRNF